MIITCPQCNTRYRLADHLLKEHGGTVRCSRCGHVFHAPPPAADTQPSGDEAPLPTEAEERSRASLRQSTLRPRRFLLLLLLLLLMLVVLLVVLFASGNVSFPQLKSRLPFFGEGSQPSSLSRKTGAPLNDLSQITFTDVRQYLVDNEKIGRLLVIEGKAVNESPVPVEMIKIQSEIFADNGTTLQRKSFYCGNTLSLFQLQVLDQAEMESALQSKVGVLTNNSNLGPEQEAPFMTVFFNPPESMAEFSLKVIEASPVNQD